MPPKCQSKPFAAPAAAIVHDDASEEPAAFDVAGLAEALGAPSAQLPEQLRKYRGESWALVGTSQAQELKEQKILHIWAKRVNQEVKAKKWPQVCALFELGTHLCPASKDKDRERLAHLMPEMVKGTLDAALKWREGSVVMRVVSMLADDEMEELPRAVHDATMKKCAKSLHQVFAADWLDANAQQNCAEAIHAMLTSKTGQLVDVKALCQAFKATTSPFLQSALLQIIRSLTNKTASKNVEAKLMRERGLKAMGEVLGEPAANKWDELLANTKVDHQQLTDFLIYYHSSGSEVAVLPCAAMSVEECKDELTPDTCFTNFISFTKNTIGVTIELLDIVGHSHPVGSRHVMLPIEALRGVNKVPGRSKDIQIHISERYATAGAKQMPGKKITLSLTVDSEQRMKEVVKGMMPHWKEQMQKGAGQRTQRGKRERDTNGSNESTTGAQKKPRVSRDASSFPSLPPRAAASAPPSPPAGGDTVVRPRPVQPPARLASRQVDIEEGPDEDGDGDSSMDGMVDNLKKQIKQHDKKKRTQAHKELAGAMKHIEQQLKVFKDSARAQCLVISKQSEEMVEQVEDAKKQLARLRALRDRHVQEMNEMNKKFEVLEGELDVAFVDVLKECEVAPAEYERCCRTFLKDLSADVNQTLGVLGGKIDKLHNKKELRTLLGAVIARLRSDGDGGAESDGSGA